MTLNFWFLIYEMVRWLQELVEELLPTARWVGSKPSRFREPRAQYASPSLPKKKVQQRNQPNVLSWCRHKSLLRPKSSLSDWADSRNAVVWSDWCSIKRKISWYCSCLAIRQHFTLYFEMCFDPSVLFFGSVLVRTVPERHCKHTCERGVRVSEGAHRRKCWGIVHQRGHHLLEDRWAPGERPRWYPRWESQAIANLSHRPSSRGPSASTSLRRNSGDWNSSRQAVDKGVCRTRGVYFERLCRRASHRIPVLSILETKFV